MFHKLAETDAPTCGRCCIAAALCSAPSYRWLVGDAPLAASRCSTIRQRFDTTCIPALASSSSASGFVMPDCKHFAMARQQGCHSSRLLVMDAQAARALLQTTILACGAMRCIFSIFNATVHLIMQMMLGPSYPSLQLSKRAQHDCISDHAVCGHNLAHLQPHCLGARSQDVGEVWWNVRRFPAAGTQRCMYGGCIAGVWHLPGVLANPGHGHSKVAVCDKGCT